MEHKGNECTFLPNRDVCPSSAVFVIIAARACRGLAVASLPT